MFGILKHVRKSAQIGLAALWIVATATGTLAQTVALPTTLTDDSGYIWDIQSDGNINNGTSDAYDGGERLSGFPSLQAATPELDGRQLSLGPYANGTLQLQRKIYIPANRTFARFLEQITNTGSTTTDYTLQLRGNLGSDGSTVLVADSSGNGTADTDDTWFITDDQDSGGDPTMVHIVRGAQGGVTPSIVERSGDNISVDYQLSIPAGQTVSILHFAAQQPNQTAALDLAPRLADLSEEGALEGLAPEEMHDIVNFNLAGGIVVSPREAQQAVGSTPATLAPTQFSFALSNEGTNAAAWSASESADWLSILPPSSGTLAPGASTDLLVQIQTNQLTGTEQLIEDTVTFNFPDSTSSVARTIRALLIGDDGIWLHEDFEGSATGWTLSGDWEIGQPLSGPLYAADGTNAAGTSLAGDYTDATNSVLESPTIQLPDVGAGGNISLSFDAWSDFESFETLECLIRRNGGTWQPLIATMSPSQAWTRVELSLSSYSGQSVSIGWRLSSDESISGPGAFIDNVTVTCGFAPYLGLTITGVDSLHFPYVYLGFLPSTNGVLTEEIVLEELTIHEDGILQDERLELLRPGVGGSSRLADIVFIMDNSGSMSSEQDAVEENVQDFVDGLSQSGVDDALGLCRYGQGAESGYPIIEDDGLLTTDPTYFTDVVWQRNVASGGNEPAFDSVAKSVQEFIYRPGSSKVLIIITDEQPDQGEVTEAEAIEAAKSIGATVYVLTEPELFPDFEALTEETGGQMFDIRSDFETILEEISQAISGVYLLRYRTTETEAAPEARTVTLELAHAGHAATAMATYIPRSTPRIERTAATLALHNIAHPAGAPITLSIQTIDNVQPYATSARLFYRATGEEAFRYTAMTTLGLGLWEATIPAETVRFPGVDYFITATDGETSTSNPSLEPRRFAYQLAVVSNTAPTLVHSVVTLPAEETPLPISCTAADDTTALDSVTLYHRESGQLLYHELSMSNTTADTFVTTIPSNNVTRFGTEYFIHAIDDRGVGTFHGTVDTPNITLPPVIGVTPTNLIATLETGCTTSLFVTVTSEAGGHGVLSFEPASGALTPPGAIRFDPLVGHIETIGASVPVELQLDATGLDTGTNHLGFEIRSNDPLTPTVPITLTLTVVGAPDLTYPEAPLDFGTVFLGTSSSLPLPLANQGFATYSGSVTTSDGFLTPSEPGVTCAPDATALLEIVFTPTELGMATGGVLVTGNDPDTPVARIPMTAMVVPPPVLNVSHQSISTSVTHGARAQIPLMLGNLAGGADLELELTVLQTTTPIHAGDAFGYTWTDSHDTNGPAYQWMDIRDIGTPTSLSKENSSTYVTLPFPFPLYGKNRSQLRMSNSGTLRTSGNASYNYPLPTASYDEAIIASLWDDLTPSDTGTNYVYHDTIGHRFIIQYTDWTHASADGSYTWQTHLYENGIIQFMYHTITGTTESATIGCQNDSGTDGLQIAYNQPYLQSDHAVRITPPDALLKLPLGRMLVLEGSSATVNLHLDASGFGAGTYQSELRLTSNDPDAPQTLIPISITVTGSPDVTLAEVPPLHQVTYVGYPTENTVRIVNHGTAPLSIANVQASAEHCVVQLPAGTTDIPPGMELHAPIRFSPTAPGTVTCQVSVASNDPDEPSATIDLTLPAAFPPVLNIDTTPIFVPLEEDKAATRTVVIDNTSGLGAANVQATLRWSQDGYARQEATETGPSSVEWFDISTIGQPSGLTDGVYRVSVPLPFSFPFFGETFTNIEVSAYGYIGFDPDEYNYDQYYQRIPSTSYQNGFIAPFWQTLQHGDGTNYVYHDEDAGRFIVQYDHWGDGWYSNGDYTFQVHLHTNGVIAFAYHSMTGSLNRATVGIESPDGTRGIELVKPNTTDYATNSHAVRLVPVHDEMTLTPDQLTVPAGGTGEFVLQFSTTNLPAEALLGTLDISSNDPELRSVTIPVSLEQLRGAPYTWDYSSWQGHYWPAGAPDGSVDSDGDGACDRDEWVAGTDPLNARSSLHLQHDRSAPLQADHPALRWPSVSNRVYFIDSAIDPAGPFILMYADIPATPPENQKTLNFTSPPPRVFFRIRAENE